MVTQTSGQTRHLASSLTASTRRGKVHGFVLTNGSMLFVPTTSTISSVQSSSSSPSSLYSLSRRHRLFTLIENRFMSFLRSPIRSPTLSLQILIILIVSPLRDLFESTQSVSDPLTSTDPPLLVQSTHISHLCPHNQYQGH